MRSSQAARWLRWGPPVLVAFVTFLVFQRALQYGFVWDDDLAFYENPYYRGLGWAQLKWMWTTFYLGAYRPLTWMTHGLDDVLWGWQPARYHLANIFLHVVNAVIVYFLARDLLIQTGVPREDTGDRAGMGVCAGAAALLFAIHPLRVEPVAWVSGRADVLAGTFLLLTVLAYLKYGAGFTALGLYFLSLVSKPVGPSLPIVLLILDVYPLKRLSGPERLTVRAVSGLLREKILFFALAAGAVRLAFLSKAKDMSPVSDSNLLEKGFQIVTTVAFYLWKMLVPFRLSPMYERSFHVDPMTTRFLASAAAVVILTLIVVIGRHRWPAALAAWGAYLALILPTSGVVQFGWQMAADRYTYVACLPWTLLAGGVVWRIWPVGREQDKAWHRVAVTGLLLSALSGLAFLSWRQAGIWRSDDTLWVHALSVDPHSAVVHNNFGRILYRRGLLDQAATHIETALELQPNYPEAHNNMGALFMRRGKRREAIEHYRKALEIWPEYEAAQSNLDAALGRPTR